MTSALARVLERSDYDFSNSTGVNVVRSLTESASVKHALTAAGWGMLLHTNEAYTWKNSLSARLCFLETSMIAVADAIYNVAMTIIFTTATLLTFGLVRCFRGNMKFHGLKALYASLTVIYGLAGTLAPKYAPKYVGGAMAMGVLYLYNKSILSDLEKLGAELEKPDNRGLIDSCQNGLVIAIGHQLKASSASDWTAFKTTARGIAHEAAHRIFRG